MGDMEFNKIFAAVLVAGIAAWSAMILSNHLIHPHELEEDAYKVEGVEMTPTGSGYNKPVGPEPILGLLAEADIERGKKLSRACAACHSFNEGGANGVGPNIWDMVMADKAAVAGFSYSDALKTHGGKWTYQSLNHFLWKPKKYIPGTKMNYIGLKKPEDRAAMIAWLRTLSSSPADLPSAEEVAAEAPLNATEESASEEEAAEEESVQ